MAGKFDWAQLLWARRRVRFPLTLWRVRIFHKILKKFGGLCSNSSRWRFSAFSGHNTKQKKAQVQQHELLQFSVKSTKGFWSSSGRLDYSTESSNPTAVLSPLRLEVVRVYNTQVTLFTHTHTVVYTTVYIRTIEPHRSRDTNLKLFFYSKPFFSKNCNWFHISSSTGVTVVTVCNILLHHLRYYEMQVKWSVNKRGALVYIRRLFSSQKVGRRRSPRGNQGQSYNEKEPNSFWILLKQNIWRNRIKRSNVDNSIELPCCVKDGLGQHMQIETDTIARMSV